MHVPSFMPPGLQNPPLAPAWDVFLIGRFLLLFLSLKLTYSRKSFLTPCVLMKVSVLSFLRAIQPRLCGLFNPVLTVMTDGLFHLHCPSRGFVESRTSIYLAFISLALGPWLGCSSSKYIGVEGWVICPLDMLEVVATGYMFLSRQ